MPSAPSKISYVLAIINYPESVTSYRDWKKGGHGSVSLNKAITESCDVYFYRLASALGIDHMHSFLQKFGFGEKSGIDLVGEKAGLLPSREWKRRSKKSGLVSRRNTHHRHRPGLSSGYALTAGQSHGNVGE